MTTSQNSLRECRRSEVFVITTLKTNNSEAIVSNKLGVESFPPSAGKNSPLCKKVKAVHRGIDSKPRYSARMRPLGEKKEALASNKKLHLGYSTKSHRAEVVSVSEEVARNQAI